MSAELRQDLSEHQGPPEDTGGADPVEESEGVIEVDNGDDETDELAQRGDQRHRQGGTLCGQDEHCSQADVSWYC